MSPKPDLSSKQLRVPLLPWSPMFSVVRSLFHWLTRVILPACQGLLENNRTNEAFEMARRISLPLNEYILATVWKICAQLANQCALDFGRDLFHRMPTMFANDRILLNSALNMFMKCGDTSTAEQIFSRMNKDLISWSIMMNGQTRDTCPTNEHRSFLSRLRQKSRVSTSHRSLLHH